MAIVLIRHGQTELNTARRLQPFDTPLSREGRAQAARVALAIAREFRLGVLLTSDAPRARETARAVARGLAADAIDEPRLRERDFGELRGRSYDGLGFDPIALREAPPGGESIEAFEARVRSGWQRLAALQLDHREADVIAVSHGLWIRTALALCCPDEDSSSEALVLGNTSVTVIELAPAPRLRRAGCVAHLEPGHQDHGVSGI